MSREGVRVEKEIEREKEKERERESRGGVRVEKKCV